MRNFVSKRAEEIPPSGIRKFFDLVLTMDDVISLGVGEPDFRTLRVQIRGHGAVRRRRHDRPDTDGA